MSNQPSLRSSKKDMQDTLFQIDRLLNEAGIPVGYCDEDGMKDYSIVQRVQRLVKKAATASQELG